jgi:uncharacterized membrane protein YidH (DUF202 family)
MTRSYSDHAADERAFLAWARTAIAVIAFGSSSRSSICVCSRWRARIRPTPATDKVHNLIVCTVCSCDPRPVLGPPPEW